MSLSPSQSRTVTELDHVRISNLLRRQPAPGGAASAIEVLLDNADLVPSQDVAPDVDHVHPSAGGDPPNWRTA